MKKKDKIDKFLDKFATKILGAKKMMTLYDKNKIKPVNPGEFVEVLDEYVRKEFLGLPLTKKHFDEMRAKIRELLGTISIVTFEDIYLHTSPFDADISFSMRREGSRIWISPDNFYTGALMGLGRGKEIMMEEV